MHTLLTPDRAVGEMLECVDTGSAVSLAPITHALGATYSLLFKTEHARDVVEGSCYGVDTRYVERLKEASRLRMLPPWLDQLEAGSVVDRALFGSDHQFSRTDFCNHVVRPEGQFHCVIATPVVSGQERYHLIVGRPRTRGEFDADNRRLLQCMLPQVAEVLQLRSDLDVARRRLSHAEQALDGLHAAVVVVERTAMVVSTNVAARSLALGRDAVWPDARGRLTASSQLDADRLRTAIDKTAEGCGPINLLIQRGVGKRPLGLTLSLLSEGSCNDPRVLVVGEPGDRADGDFHVHEVARAHGLTRREIEVATRLARGCTLKVAARDLGMSYNTARSYVRQIFEKTAVHRQNDLLRLLTTGLRPPGSDQF